MKFFSSLPKINFESTIGTFKISSFFSYYEYDSKKVLLSKVTVDNKTTLTELSNKIYNDGDSMWLFLLANKTTDPFDLLNVNPAIYKTKVKDEITLGLNPELSPTTSYLVTEGSIFTPYSATGGSAWQYSSVGNFDLNGPFTLVDTTEYFTEKMTIKGQTGGNGSSFIFVDAAVDDVIAIENEDSGFTSDDSIYQTKNKTTRLNEIVQITQSGSNTISPDESQVTAIAVAAPTPDPSYQNTGATFAVTDYQSVLNKNKDINVITPQFISTIIKNLKTLSYT